MASSSLAQDARWPEPTVLPRQRNGKAAAFQRCESDHEDLVLESLTLLQQVATAVARRHRLSREDGEDLASTVRIKLLDNDCELLRRFEGRSSLRTYFAVIVQRQLLDGRIERWGKWRPSREARRAGPVGVLLDQLLTRDDRTFDEAYEVLRANHGVTTPKEELYTLSTLLPTRTGRRFLGEDALGAVVCADVDPERALEVAEDEQSRGRLQMALRQAMRELEPQDRLLLKMRFQDGMTIAQISRVLNVDQKPLYRRQERVMARLRQQLRQGPAT